MPEIKSTFNVSYDPGATTEPLVNLIDAYRKGLTDYCRNAPEDYHLAAAYAQETYKLPRIALETWSDPAETLYGAVCALRMAMEADENDDTEVVSAMLKASLGYFEAAIAATA
ncbi:hypothetical protein [Rhizobium leguminosarum]|uniref:hypothetical protein n=1 Tax=Rhizobium leguminosarum TaxID=384 RepID=UPI001608EEEB|nr:hypothetical protein [Rhizobium leguminosarum]MBB4342111.1 hypothetical protein [Rhizobium leguminosarum]MBB6294735.1 hypothetical protein [Rhizobium leguminosarum]